VPFGSEGNFLVGLIDAGVPANVRWAPTRHVLKAEGSEIKDDPINDILWLPAAREMFGSQSYSPVAEDAENQARLEYYPVGDTGNNYRVKYTATGTARRYWEALRMLATICSFVTFRLPALPTRSLPAM
jgi:hypothetical protein